MTVAELLGLLVFAGLFFVARCIKAVQAEYRLPVTDAEKIADSEKELVIGL